MTAWNYAKWPVLFVVVVFMIALLYYAAPNAKLGGFKAIVPGSALAVAVWLIASAGFALYVANFGSYNKTYGTLGGVIVFLVWLWISNVAILLGAELNAERERSRQLKAGTRAPNARFNSQNVRSRRPSSDPERHSQGAHERKPKPRPRSTPAPKGQTSQRTIFQQEERA